jgi:predicted esterase YcpF (UPF0227 family)
MNILYIHGFNSFFDLNNEKIVSISKIEDVKLFGIDIDYLNDVNDIIEKLKTKIIDNKIDIVVGTSLGAYYANKVSILFKIPFIVFNPVIDPQETLAKLKLSKKLLVQYNEKFNKNSSGIIFLDKGDELIDSEKTYQQYYSTYKIYQYEGGTHRFSHITDAIKIIENYIKYNQIMYGIENE